MNLKKPLLVVTVLCLGFLIALACVNVTLAGTYKDAKSIGLNFVSLASSTGAINPQQNSSIPTDSWSMFGHDPTNARYSSFAAPHTSQVLWTTTLDNAVRTSVTVVGNKAYVGTFSGKVFCLDASTGGIIWNFSTANNVWSTPTIANGMVFVGSNDWTIYALNAETGVKVWNFSPSNQGIFSSPTVVNNIVYVGSCDNNVYALRADTGAIIWNFTTNGQVRDSPAVVNGIVFAGSNGGTFYALNADTGAEIWSSPTGDKDTYTNSSPAVSNGVVYVGSTDNNLYAFSITDGKQLWRYTTGAGVSSSPAVFNGVVYFGSMDTNVYAVEASTGNLVWSQKTNGAIYSSSAVADGVVYIGSWDGYVYAFDAANGSPIWNYNTGGQIFSAPTVAGGVMFVGSYNSKVFAFGISYSPTSSAPPSPISSSMPLPSAKDVTNTVWVPPVANGAITPIVTVGVIAIVAALASILSSAPASASKGFFQILADKIRGIVPDVVKKWFEDFIASKRKLRIDEKQGSPYLPTKSEAIVYALSVIISTISFAYVKVINLNQFLIILPTFFVTSILVSLVRTYLLSLYARRKGVWTEYKLWYFGVGLFLITTFALKAPFSSPTRAVHHSHNFTEKLAGVLSFASVLITLGFGALFFVILKGGFILIGGTGLAMCIISSFFDTFPIEPMGGKDIYKYHKAVWAGLFFTTLALYIVWLAQIL